MLGWLQNLAIGGSDAEAEVIALAFVARTGFKPVAIYFKGDMQAAAFLKGDITAAAYLLSAMGETVEYHKGDMQEKAFFKTDFNDQQG